MCVSPIILKKESPRQIVADSFKMLQVPCGKCVMCMKRRVNSWHARLSQHMKDVDTAFFVTLTYDDDSIPFSENGLMTLNYSDVGSNSAFIKGLRNAQRKSKKKIKYFLVGEYGSKTHRPHYHAIFFNVKNPESFQENWKFGFVHIGNVTDASLYYTLKYCVKRSFQPWNKDSDDDRLPEKASMSKGLGLNYLEKPGVRSYHKNDLGRGMPLLGNKVIGLPRYYRDKLYTDGEKMARNVHFNELRDEHYEKVIDPLYTQKVKRMNEKSKLLLTKTD